VVHEHLTACRREAEEALVRAFAFSPQKSSKVSAAKSSKIENRRSASELATLRARLYEAVLARPGETMVVLAQEVGLSGGELQFPMRQLRQTKQVRSAGQRNAMRYFPMAVAKSA
jgi:predicted transcriptional regulator